MNGVLGSYYYDNAERLDQVQHMNGTTAISTQQYTIDAVGNRTQVAEQVGPNPSTTTTYSYDHLYRLTQEAITNGAATSYAYDPVGNRTSKSVSGGATTSYSYDRADRITAAGGTSYTVDANGNRTAGAGTFSYDQANRLTSATVGSTTANYAYNGDGLRSSKTIGTGTTNYVYDPTAATPRLLKDNTYNYVWGPAGLAYLMDASKTAKSYETDGLGSVRAITDGTKTVTDWANRDAFGNITQSTTNTSQPFDFTGEMRDGETAFIYLGSRYYDPVTGRFITRDSAPSSNRYAYANNNPLTFTDPTGHMATTDDPGIATGGCEIDGCATSESGYVPYSDTTYQAAAGDLPVTYGAAAWSAPAPTAAAGPSNAVEAAPGPVDYEKASVTVGFVVVEHTVDRFGQGFYSVGASWGVPFIGFSHVHGVMKNRSYSPRDTENFLTGLTITWGGGIFNWGRGVTVSPGANNSSDETGFYTPQAGISATMGFREADLQNWRPWPFFWP